jgi:hypothetical protein
MRVSPRGPYMAISYRIDPAVDLVHVRVAGHLTPADHQAYLSALLADPAFRPGMHRLFDCRDADDSNSSDEVRLIADRVRAEAAHFGDSRCAILVRSDVQYGMARVFEAFLGDVPGDFRSFRDPAEASAWLSEVTRKPVPPP